MRKVGSQLAAVVALIFIASAVGLLLASARPPLSAPVGGSVAAASATPTAPPSQALQLPNTAESPSPSATPNALDVSGLRIRIPRLSIDLPLEVGDPARDVPRAGYAGGTPENIAFVFPGSKNPGEGGNTYIYAHARTGMFLNLWNAHLADVIEITRADGAVAWTYDVVQIVRAVDPSDTHWLDPSGPERLTLQTSTGPSPEDPRFIVVAYPSGAAQGGASPHP